MCRLSTVSLFLSHALYAISSSFILSHGREAERDRFHLPLDGFLLNAKLKHRRQKTIRVVEKSSNFTIHQQTRNCGTRIIITFKMTFIEEICQNYADVKLQIL